VVGLIEVLRYREGSEAPGPATATGQADSIRPNRCDTARGGRRTDGCDRPVFHRIANEFVLTPGRRGGLWWGRRVRSGVGYGPDSGVARRRAGGAAPHQHSAPGGQEERPSQSHGPTPLPQP
jgi:hypothetical protein